MGAHSLHPPLQLPGPELQRGGWGILCPGKQGLMSLGPHWEAGPGFESRGSHLQTNLRQLLPFLGPFSPLQNGSHKSTSSELYLGPT